MNIIFFFCLILLVLSTTAQTPKQTSSNQTQRSTQRSISPSNTVPQSTPPSNTGVNKTMSSKSTQRITSSSATVPQSTPPSNTGVNKTMSSRSTQRSISSSNPVPQSTPPSNTGVNKTMSSRSTQRSISSSNTVPQSTPPSNTGVNKTMSSKSTQRSISSSNTVPRTMPRSTTDLRTMSPITTSPTLAPSIAKGQETTVPSTTSSPFTTNPLATTSPEANTNPADNSNLHCRRAKGGYEYAGPVSVTRSGKACQRWESDQYHKNNYKSSTSFPEGSASAAGNKCRNPASDYYDGVWCYTTDPGTPWELCDVELCAMDCKYTKAGHFYAGPLNVTRSGKTCQRWDSDQYHKSNYKSEAYYFPEGSASAAGNKCRNPASDYYDGVWCYTTDPGTTWEQCDVEFCALDCKVTTGGHDYVGPLNVTRSGKTCQRWDSDQYHKNNYKSSTSFPEGSASAAGNKCRNPASDYYDGVWCYTTDPGTPWELCDVELCDFNLDNY